jgi:hypothetical protein
MSTAPASDTRTAGRKRPTNRVVFDADVTLNMPAERAWAQLVDWGGHGRWIPMTRVDVDPQDPNRFVAWSGLGRSRLALEDRMHATDRQFDGQRGTCRVEKLGPVLVGFAEVTVTAEGERTRVLWHEDVEVPYLPKFLSPAVGKVAALLFGFSLKRMPS